MSDEYGPVEPGSVARSRAFGLSLIAVAVVLVAVVATIVATKSGGHGTTNPKAGATAPAKVLDPNASLCGLPGYETSGTVTSAPAGVTWSLLSVNQMALPSAPGAGPGRTSPSGVRYCYAHTPVGAVLAAENLPGMLALGTTSSAIADEVGQRLITGAGASSLVAELKQPGQTIPGLVVQIRGFDLIGYTGEQAVVDVASQGTTTDNQLVLAHVQIQLQWVGNDWRYEALPGAASPAEGSLSSLAGYVLMSGA